MLRAIEILEQAIYAAIAFFLLLAGIGLCIAAVRLVFQLPEPALITATIVALLDQILLVFMVVELVYTVRVTLRDRSLAVEPFLIIAVIAGVRRILVLTAEAEAVESGVHFQEFWIELLLLMALVLSMVIAIVLWRRAYPAGKVPL